MKVKKIISVLLCVSMIFGVMSVGATQVFAAGESECEHNFVQTSTSAPTCSSHGETKYECSNCGQEKTEYTSATTGYTWDFSTGSAESVNGDPKNQLSFVYSHEGVDTDVVISDGELSAHRSIYKMSQPVTLDSANDWTAEIVAKGNGTDALRTVFSTERGYSAASFIYINASGDMVLSNKGTLTTDDGTTKTTYVYYKTSNEDYDKSILKSADFDVTEYHTYQMKCIGGVFSTWVDGEKIGNLCMTEFTPGRSASNPRYTQGTGTPFDFSKMTMQYVGNGANSNANYGLTATVKYLGVYPGHTFDNVCDTDCNNEGCDYVREASHNWEQVLSTNATCNSRGEAKYTCSVCGQEKTECTSATSGYTWDFSTGSAESLNGDPKNQLSFFSSSGGDTSVVVSDGELCAHQTLMSMSQPVTLNSANDWTIEIVAKGNGSDAIRTVFSQGRSFSTATFIYINGVGDMFLSPGKRAMTTDDGTTKTDYVYYKTSNEDYNKSILKRADFDVTEYHTYQMKCIGGVFSTWVDGEKIGDLCMSEFLTTRAASNPRYTQGNGTPFYDEYFKQMTMDYVGNGPAAGKATYGLTATVKYLGIYPGHTFDNVCDADCNNEGCDYVRNVSHHWDNGVVTTAPTETEAGVKTYTCTLCGETKEVTIPSLQGVVLSYDDRYDISELGQQGEPVITNQVVTSKKVCSESTDENVLVYADGKLIATGVGTADVTWGTGDNAVTYKVTVKPAKISMMMVTGHSLGSGSQGSASENVLCEEGQVYCTNERAYSFKITTGSSSAQTVEPKDVTGLGLGYASENRPPKIDMLTASGTGVNGCESSVAYEWTRLTGEKIWILNSAKGSTSLQTWQAGGYNYRHAVTLFRTAEEILYNEVQAGHYSVNKLGIINYTTANGDQTWSIEKYTNAFNSMWNGFKTEMARYDFDGDNEIDTVDCIGLLPLWNVCSMNQWDNLRKEPLAFISGSTAYYGKIINYSMSEFEDNGVMMASTVGRNWTSDADVTAYFEANPISSFYGTLHNGTTHSNPTTMKNGVFADGVHYAQLGYNVQGVETARSLYDYWYGKNKVTDMTLVQGNGVDPVPDNIELKQGDTYAIVPLIVKSSGKLDFEIEGNAISYNNCIVTANRVGNSTLTIKSRDGSISSTVNITVTEGEAHEPELSEYYVWDFAKGSTVNTSGATLDNELSLVKTKVSGVSSASQLISNGTLNLSKQTTLKLSKPVSLSSENDWMVELTAKGDGATTMRSFLATGDQIASSTYFYISDSGDLSIVKKGSYTDDGGTSRSGYVYYKVSNTSFNNSVLASGDFDITQYHTYQVRCNDGTLSFWLDGEKIGNFALSETSAGRGGSTGYTKGKGTPFNFNNLTVTQVGCGNTSDAASQSLTATVKSLALYTGSCELNLSVGLDAIKPIDPIYRFPGDSVILPHPETGDYCAKFVGWNDKVDGTGNMYQAGDTFVISGLEQETLYGFWDASEIGDGVHNFVDGVCTHCGAIDESYAAYYGWDFSFNAQATKGGANTITLATKDHSGNTVTNNGTMSVLNGRMDAENAAMELSKTILLDSSKNWAVDYKMKAKVDANGNAIIPKVLFAENKLFSIGTSAYLTKDGDIILAQKGTVKGKNAYWYYMVSDADFNANMPKDFDITKDHTYRLMCTNGVISFWLDGAKIGDLSITCDGMDHSSASSKYEGRFLNYSSIKAKYIGNGNTGNIKTFGFTGDVDEINFYTDGGFISFDNRIEQAEEIAPIQAFPEEKITLSAPDTGDYCAKFIGWADSLDDNANVYEAGSQYPVSGMSNVTLYALWEFPENGNEHIYGEGVVTPPNCQADGYTTRTCEFCGHSVKSDFVPKVDHDFSAAVVDNKYLKESINYNHADIYYKSCTMCGASSEGSDEEETFSNGYAGDGYYSVVSKKDYDTAPGIKESEIVLNNDNGNRRQVMHVMEADISNEYVSILPSYMGMNPTEGNYSTAGISKQAEWVEKNMGLNVVGGMNTALSWYDSEYYQTNPNKKGEPLGVFVVNGNVYSNNTSAKTCLVVNYDEKDGVQRPESIPKVQIRYTSEGLTGWEEQVVSCNFDFVVKNGKNVTKTASHTNEASKSVLGIKADGTIVMMEADGRLAPYSGGMSVYEIGEAMIKLGCVYAIRGDGGGSSTFISQRPGEELKINNSPSDGVERPTTHGILFVSTAPSNGVFAKANLSTENSYYAPGCTVDIEAIGTDLVGKKVEIPDDVSWNIVEDGMGTIENGKFISNGTTGPVTVQMIYNEKVVGSCSFTIVVPETFAFKQSKITVPFGKTVDLVMVGTINNGLNTVVLNPDDIDIVSSNEDIGTIDGQKFTAVDQDNAPENLTSVVTATLHCANDMQATAELLIGRASEVIADFEDGVSYWSMTNWNARCDYELRAATEENGYVHSGNGALGMIFKNSTQMADAMSYAQFAIRPKSSIIIENALSVGAWIYIPDDFYNLWIEMQYFTKDADGNYTVPNNFTVFSGGQAYTSLEESGWHYFSLDISDKDSVMIRRDGTFIEALMQHCSTNEMLRYVGSPHGQSAIYVDDITVDYSLAADDKEEPIFGTMNLVDGDKEYQLKKNEFVTTANNSLTVKANVTENNEKANASGIAPETAKAYVDGVEVEAAYANGVISIDKLKVAKGTHRVKFEISDNSGNKAVIIRVINVENSENHSAIEVVPKDPSLDRLYGGSLYWVDINATMIETIQEISMDIDLNAVNHWELEHMELAPGFKSEFTIDEKTNTATIVIRRTGENTSTGKQKLASLPIRVIYFDTDIALSGYTAETFWMNYNFWPQDVKIDVDRGEITYVDYYQSAVLDTFSSPEYAIDTEMYINGQYMDTDYKNEKGTAHVHVVTELEDKAPTHTEEGYTGRTYCEICDSVVDWGTSIPSIGHSFESTGDGINTCTICGEKSYFVNGVAQIGWIKIDENTYYYGKADGILADGEYTIEGHTYNFTDCVLTRGSWEYDSEKHLICYWAGAQCHDNWYIMEGKKYHFTGTWADTGVTRIGKGMGGYEIYVFDETGAWLEDYNGLFIAQNGVTYAENGKGIYYGLAKSEDGDYYYINSQLRAVTNCTYSIGEAKTNGLLPAGRYQFDESGKMLNPPVDEPETEEPTTVEPTTVEPTTAEPVTEEPTTVEPTTEKPETTVKNGLVFDDDGEIRYYVDDVPQYKGLVKSEAGDYYYINSTKKAVKDCSYSIAEPKTNGLVPAGHYRFDADGKMVLN